MSKTKVIVLAREALRCRSCFELGGLRPATVDLPQPHVVPDDYFAIRPKIVLLAQNPGAGSKRTKVADQKMQHILQRLRDGADTWDDYLDHCRTDMPNWGNGDSKYQLALKAMGLLERPAALGNVAMCAVSEDKDFRMKLAAMCGHRHLLSWLRLLDPDIAILMGDAAQQFEYVIRAELPRVEVIGVPHYVVRSADQREKRNKGYEDARKMIKGWSSRHVE